MNCQLGLVTGVVKEVDTKQGRIRIEYHDIEDKLLSPWAYIAAPLSGKKRGQLFMPEVDDEALVGYADGCFDYPFVLGYLWNGDEVSPETEASNRVIVTPGGHQLRFEDKKDDTRIVLKSHGGHVITLEDNAKNPHVSVKSNKERELLLDDEGSGKVVITSGENRITMDDAPSGTTVEIKAGKNLGVTITMNASPKQSLSIKVGSSHSITVDDSGMSVETTGAVNVKAGSTVNVTAAGMATVKCSTASLTATAGTSISTGVLSVTGTAMFSGIVLAPTLVSTTVVGSAYMPGVGNMM